MKSNALIESLECAVILVDHQLIVQRVNISAEILFSRSRRYLIGKKLFEIIPDKQVLSSLELCKSNYSQFSLREISLDVNGEESLVDVTLSHLASEQLQEPFYLIEINSINRISRFMREKNQLERQQSFRLMMRGLAHEIKNPLGGIRGAAQLLDREIEKSSQKELTDILIKEADRLTRLVDRVMGSRDQLRPQYLNVHEVLEHVAHLVTVRNDEQLFINRFYDPALPEIKVDKEQLIQAVLNIVGNAIEAQKNSEKITIGFITKFERFVTLNQVMHRQVLKIKIWDEGPGVPDSMKEIIFDPLITGRPEGTGLGLSITQEIIQRHQGVVQLESFNVKTCFSIYLPYLDEKQLKKIEDKQLYEGTFQDSLEGTAYGAKHA